MPRFRNSCRIGSPVSALVSFVVVLSTARRVARAALGILFLYSGSLSSAFADGGCVELHPILFRPEIRWDIKSSLADIAGAASPAVVDLDNNGRDELVVITAEGSLASLEWDDANRFRKRELGPLHFNSPGVRISRLRRMPNAHDTISELLERQVAIREFEGSPGQPRIFSQFQFVGPREFLQDLFDWKCSTSAASSFVARHGSDCGDASVVCYECIGVAQDGTMSPVGHDVISARLSVDGFGDFNGDHEDELLLADRARGIWSLSSFRHVERVWSQYPAAFNEHRVKVGDVNGDGLADVLAFADQLSGVWIAYSLGMSALESSSFSPIPSAVESDQIQIGDFNGDSTADVMYLPEASAKQEIRIAFSEKPESVAASVVVIVLEPLVSPSILLPVPQSVGQIRVFDIEESATFCGLGTSRSQVLLIPREFSPTSRAVSPRSGETEKIVFLAGLKADTRPVAGRPLPYRAASDNASICVGYYEMPYAGMANDVKWGSRQSLCPAGAGYFGAAEGDSAYRYPQGVCCPLPNDDVLTDISKIETKACAPGYVVTGSPPASEKFRCTKINDERYLLGEETDGAYWGSGFSGRRQKRRIQLVEIPLAIRFGISRTGFSNWEIDGCIGIPYGSLLVRPGGEFCSDSKYRQLLYKGAPGDPPAGTPVKMFPDCGALENVYSPLGGCFPTSGSKQDSNR